MKKELIDGKEFTVFDDLEEMKWYYHSRLCNSPSNRDFDRLFSEYTKLVAEMVIHIASKDTVAAVPFDPLNGKFGTMQGIGTPKVYDEASKGLVAEANKFLEDFNEPCRVRVIA